MHESVTDIVQIRAVDGLVVVLSNTIKNQIPMTYTGHVTVFDAARCASTCMAATRSYVAPSSPHHIDIGQTTFLRERKASCWQLMIVHSATAPGGVCTSDPRSRLTRSVPMRRVKGMAIARGPTPFPRTRLRVYPLCLSHREAAYLLRPIQVGLLRSM